MSCTKPPSKKLFRLASECKPSMICCPSEKAAPLIPLHKMGMTSLHSTLLGRYWKTPKVEHLPRKKPGAPSGRLRVSTSIWSTSVLEENVSAYHLFNVTALIMAVSGLFQRRCELGARPIMKEACRPCVLTLLGRSLILWHLVCWSR